MSATQTVRVLRPFKFDATGVRKPGALIEVPTASAEWLIEGGYVERATRLAVVDNETDDDESRDDDARDADEQPARRRSRKARK